MNGAGRCPCEDSRNACLSCKPGELPSGSAFGVRPDASVRIRFKPDPARDRAQTYNPGGYMRQGYDTGRGR